MSERNDGGPAFPTFEELEQYDGDAGEYREFVAPVGGMSLRDYFAAKAMQALIAHYGDQGDDPRCAAISFGFADAMLKAREASK